MKFSDEFRDRSLITSLVEELSRLCDRPVRIMEVCGTHTMSVFQHGLRSLLPEGLELVSGPGCPVCVTSAAEIDAFVELSQIPNVIIATFGDLVKVPGSRGSLVHTRAEGAAVEVVYSAADALRMAVKDRSRLVVFPAVGFETTIPTVAATIKEARRQGLENFFVFSAHKIMPPALDALMTGGKCSIDGLLCPGHVSIITGARVYEPLAEKFHIPCVVAGFEPVDILHGLLMLLRQTREGRAEVENAYPRAVSRNGNERARKLMWEVFDTVDAEWRGLGTIAGSGLALRSEFSAFDAAARFGVRPSRVPEPAGCRCGDILRAEASPRDCGLFAGVCTPSAPVGPCMVSGEGACAAYYRYEGKLNIEKRRGANRAHADSYSCILSHHHEKNSS